jgi:hypothetical protein
MDWKEIAAKITSLAPAVGAALGGPVGGAAGTAISLLAKALGIQESEATPDKIGAALSGPVDEWKFKLLTAENEFKLKMKELELMEIKAYLADVQGARERERSIVQATGKKDVNLYVLAWTIIAGFFGLVGILVFVAVPQDSSGVVYMLFGALSAGFGAVIQYFFGSSAGSAEKSRFFEALTAAKKGG